MRLIGMLDSPYVRRVAVSMTAMALPYRHEPVSVFRHYDAFAAINPVVKAPTLITDDGVALMDSTLILDFVEALAPPERRLTPPAADRPQALRIVGLALTACEKTVQIVYERTQRPEDKRHQPWLDRLRSQLQAAYALLEAEIGTSDWLFGPRPLQPDITAAVAWRFTRELTPDAVDPDGHPRLAALSHRAEALPAFLAAPFA